MPPQVVFITGCSTGGIGASLVEAFASAGCIVYATARRVEAMDGLKNVGDIRKFALDVNVDESVQNAVKTIIDAEGRIDILINNAGVLCVGPILDISVETAQSVFETNVFAVLRIARAVVPHMAKRKSGLVMNIGSITAIVPIPFGGMYAATKAALRSITDTLYCECKPLGVHVMLVEPGGVKSKLSVNAAPNYSLPADSLYKAYISNIDARMQISQSPGTMDTDEFAAAIMKKTLKPPSPPRYISIGNMSTSMWILSFLPRGLALWLLWRRVGTIKKA